MKKINCLIFWVLILMIVAPLGAGAAQTTKLPKLLTISTHNVGSSTQAVAVGFSKTFSKYLDIKVNVESRGNNIERMSLLKEGLAQLAVTNAHYVHFPQNGLGEFSVAEWGPQPIRMLFRCIEPPVGLASLGDSKIKKPEDLKGARVAYYAGNAGLLYTTAGGLYFHGIKWDDVVKVPVSGYVPGHKALLDGRADVAFCGNTAKSVQEIAASIHGIHWFNFPKGDNEGWKRLQSVAPFDLPAPGVTFGAGISPNNPRDLYHHPYTIICYDNLSDHIAYELTRVMYTAYDYYKNFSSRLKMIVVEDALKVEKLPPYPYHPGSIQYFKEIGKWTPELEKWQQSALDKASKVKANWKPHKPVFEPQYQ